MPTRRITGTFFYLSQAAPRTMNTLFDTLKKKFDDEEEKLINIKVKEEYFRIVELSNENFLNVGRDVWVGIIEKLDTKELTVTSDMLGNRQVHGEGEEEGPVTHTGFVFDPLTSVFFLHKRIGGINYDRLGKFLRDLLEETNLVKDSKKYQLSVLPDPDKLDRLKRAPAVKELTFAYKVPTNVGNLEQQDNGIVRDLLMADDFNSEFIRIEIRGHDLDKNLVVKKVEQLKELLGKGLSSAKAVAEHDDIEETLDLLKDRLTDFHDVELTKGKKVTEYVILDAIKVIFNNNVGVLDQRFRSGMNSQ